MIFRCIDLCAYNGVFSQECTDKTIIKLIGKNQIDGFADQDDARYPVCFRYKIMSVDFIVQAITFTIMIGFLNNFIENIRIKNAVNRRLK